MVWTPRTTVAAIIERDGKFLMVKELINGETRYNQPAGHLEANENLQQAVVRETREETAWQFHPEAITGIYLWRHPVKDRTYLRVTFCGQCDDHQPSRSLDSGILTAEWMSLEEIREREAQCRSPMVLQNIEDYLAGKRYPLSLLTDMQAITSPAD